MRRIRITPWLALAALLAACSSLPLPATIDLRAQLGEAAAGTEEVSIGAGDAQDFDVELPEAGGTCSDLSNESFPVTVRSAQLHWNVDVAYEGPELGGRIQARLFVAGPDEELFHPSNTLGPTFTVNLDRPTTRLAGTANLGPDQLEAVNDRLVCWGVQLTGDDVSAATSGDAVITYDIRELVLRIRFSVI